MDGDTRYAKKEDNVINWDKEIGTGYARSTTGKSYFIILLLIQ